jgi:hypothetical protein
MPNVACACNYMHMSAVGHVQKHWETAIYVCIRMCRHGVVVM